MSESRAATVATLAAALAVFVKNVILDAAYDLPTLVRWTLSVPVGVVTWQVVRCRLLSAPTSS